MRPLNGDDRVTLVNDDGVPTVGIAALPANLTPALDEVEQVEGQFQVIIVVQQDARNTRCLAALLSAVRTDDVRCFLKLEQVLAFATTWKGGRIYVAAQNKLLKQAQAIDESGMVSTGLSGLATGTTSGPQGTRAKLFNTWNNCGRTSANLIEALREPGKLDQIATDGRYPPGEYKDLLKNLADCASDGKSYLVDCSFEGIHTFTLEIRPRGCYLVQGYQGAYSAFWWQGLAEHPLALPGPGSAQTQLPDNWGKFGRLTADLRERFGLGRPLKPAELLSLMHDIGTMISLGTAGRWSESAFQLYTKLPFYPGQDALDLTGESKNEKDKRKTVGETTKPSEPKAVGLIVNVSVITAPDQAQHALSGKTEGESLCHLVLAKVTADLLEG